MVINDLTILVLLPLAVALVNLFVPTILRKILTFGALAYLLLVVYRLFGNNTEEVVLFGQSVLALDKLAYFTLAFIQIMSFVILIFSLKGVDKAIRKEFFILYPLTVAFSNGAVLSTHAVALLIFWGLSGISLYLFGMMGNEEETPQTAKKTFLIVGGSDVFLILGLVLLWFLEPRNGWALWNVQLALKGQLAYLAFFSILIAAFAKAGGFPLHSWVPDYSKDAPVESVAFLPASLDKLLGIYLLARIVLSLFMVNIAINLLLITLGALTVIIAVMMALVQHNGRKLLGYHAVSQVGYMIMGVGSGSVIAFIGGLFHLANNTIYKSNLLLALGSVEKRTGTNDLEKLGGLGRAMPFTFVMALIGALSISGIPPFNGFFSKWLIYQGILEKAATVSEGYQIWLLICLILAVFGSALTLASFMKFIHAIFLGKRPQSLKDVKEGPANQWLSTGILALLCIVFGLFAIEVPLKKFILPIAVEQGWPVPQLLGNYDPLLVACLTGIAFVLGWIVFLFTRKTRYDEIYLGGMDALEKFRVTGTEFYNEIRNMRVLKKCYDWAGKKYFDLYDLGSRCSLSVSKVFRYVHSGSLQLYSLWIVFGLLILFVILV